MEKSAANHQLPEVDSLPVGFVENCAEPPSSTPSTLTLEQQQKEEKSPIEDTFDPSTDSDPSPKLRTFPVLLSDKESFSVDTEDSAVTVSSHSEPEAPVGVHEASVVRLSEPENTTIGGCRGVFGESFGRRPFLDGGNDGSPPRATGGCSDLEAANLKEKSTSDCAELLKKKKLETTEAKRKNVKQSFKSEREFLEFTLKYQQVIAERDSAVAVRDKLESLCRELQRQNKMLMDECKRVSTEGQNMRLDLSTRFHGAIKDVNQKLEGQKDECLTQLKENDLLRNQLKHLSDQYVVSEEHFMQKLKQKNLELQLAELKNQQHEEKLTQGQSQMKLYAEQVSQLLATERTLRLQLAADGEKFQQFQDALTKSNDVFETFKQEIEKMAKSIKELKKENSFLKGKCERSDVTLIELIEEREQWKQQMEKMKKQKEKLESLCRSLQAERKLNSGANSDSVTKITVS